MAEHSVSVTPGPLENAGGQSPFATDRDEHAFDGLVTLIAPSVLALSSGLARAITPVPELVNGQ